jgi:hypothetical protein
LRDGEVVNLGGGKRVRFIDTPHAPHGWDAVLYEESTGTLMCGDLFTWLGNDRALTDSHVVGPAIAAEALFKYSCLNPSMGTMIRSLSNLAPPHTAFMPWRMITTVAFPVRCPRLIAAGRPKSFRTPRLASIAGPHGRLLCAQHMPSAEGPPAPGRVGGPSQSE